MAFRPSWTALVAALGVWCAAQVAPAQQDTVPVVPAPPVDPAQDAEPEPYRPGDPVVDAADEAVQDEYGDPRARGEPRSPTEVRYLLEAIQVEGNKRTKGRVIRQFVPLKKGELLDPGSPEIEAIKWRLMGTGWFDRVETRLDKGSQRGWVVLVIEVKERSSVTIGEVAIGIAEGLSNNFDQTGDLRPFFGASVSETNLAGQGIRLTGTVVFAQRTQGVRLALTDPRRIARKYAIRTAGLFINAVEYYGRRPLVSYPCTPSSCPTPSEPASAVLPYRRGGLMLGTGRDIGTSTSYTIDWQGDFVNALNLPDAASEPRGNDIRPIDFYILPGRSFVSTLRFGLTYDRRDDPGITSQGLLLRAFLTGGTRLLGSDYDFLKVEGMLRKWWRLPWRHSVRLGAFAGVAIGETPFFYLYHISDFSDLLPSRVMEVMVDRRPPPNLLNTSIAVMRQEELALRLDVAYELPVYRRRNNKGLRALNAYFLIGVYSLSDLQDPRTGFSGYEGASRIPVDLTFDFGFRFDTRAGVIQVGFSNFVGFIRL